MTGPAAWAATAARIVTAANDLRAAVAEAAYQTTWTGPHSDATAAAWTDVDAVVGRIRQDLDTLTEQRLGQLAMLGLTLHLMPVLWAAVTGRAATRQAQP